MNKVVLIDDESLASDMVEEYLKPLDNYHIAARCLNGFEGFKTIQELKPDLIFLDVQMPKINGFEMLELLENPPAVIFTTAFDEHAIKAFEANAIDYLLKPFSQERFNQAIKKFENRSNTQVQEQVEALAKEPALKNGNRVVVKDGGKIKIVPIKDIFHLDADGDYVTIFSTGGKYTMKKTLATFEESLSPEVFVRVHRSHLINVSFIERIDPYGKNNHTAKMTDGVVVPISRNGYQKLKTLLRL